jgi:dGTPase
MYQAGDETRLCSEPDKPGIPTTFRSAWRRDYGRVIHSSSFRRLQGKTQLFYGSEGVFRNRLTHSLEVAQIAKSLALRLNHEFNASIEPDIAEIAGLIHDLGHPPFGHNGEKALDDAMLAFGGFEGNAQTFRILVAAEKRVRLLPDTDSASIRRCGLNLTARVLASSLKYDREIPRCRVQKGVTKGYYSSEAGVVEFVKASVAGACSALPESGAFRTIECQVMDLADDIAYSTYDLEDAWKAGLVGPLDLVAVPERRLREITRRVNKVEALHDCTEGDVRDVLMDFVAEDLQSSFRELAARAESPLTQDDVVPIAGIAFQDMNELAQSGYRRTRFTSSLIERFVTGIDFEPNENCPPLSRAAFTDDVLLAVEALKQYVYVSVIESPRLRIPEYRGYGIVKGIFKACSKRKGMALLPDDVREELEDTRDKEERMRAVCDFVAGMTDQYAVSFFNRLTLDSPATIFGPSI